MQKTKTRDRLALCLLGHRSWNICPIRYPYHLPARQAGASSTQTVSGKQKRLPEKTGKQVSLPPEWHENC